MPSIMSGFEYDIFISYRQTDNRSDLVMEFVKTLQLSKEDQFGRYIKLSNGNVARSDRSAVRRHLHLSRLLDRESDLP